MRVPRGATWLVALLLLRGTSAAHPKCVDRTTGKSCEVPPPPDRGAVWKGELFHTVATKQSRAQLSAWLVAPANRAAKEKRWAKAIPYFQALVVARGPGSREAKELATIWTLAGQHEQAADAWLAYASAIAPGPERHAAESESRRLVAIKDPFADKLALAALASEAKQAFARGRVAFAAKHYGDALVQFHIGQALAPELPGFFRELGATYDKLGALEPKRELYLRYLRLRPLGANADAVRAVLAKDPPANALLGTLVVTESLPCTELWLNRQRITKIPATGFAVAPGQYKGLCFNPKYEMALFEYATVEPGKPAAMTFRWAILENRLERPYGRIALENPKSPGTMIDLGITSKVVGVAAPGDGRKLKMILRDDSGQRVEERMLEVAPGQRIAVQW